MRSEVSGSGSTMSFCIKRLGGREGGARGEVLEHTCTVTPLFSPRFNIYLGWDSLRMKVTGEKRQDLPSPLSIKAILGTSPAGWLVPPHLALPFGKTNNKTENHKTDLPSCKTGAAAMAQLRENYHPRE